MVPLEVLEYKTCLKKHSTEQEGITVTPRIYFIIKEKRTSHLINKGLALHVFLKLFSRLLVLIKT